MKPEQAVQNSRTLNPKSDISVCNHQSTLSYISLADDEPITLISLKYFENDKTGWEMR